MMWSGSEIGVEGRERRWNKNSNNVMEINECVWVESFTPSQTKFSLSVVITCLVVYVPVWTEGMR